MYTKTCGVVIKTFISVNIEIEMTILTATNFHSKYNRLIFLN